MEIGLGRLRLAPQDFWRMTLAELAAAARGTGLSVSDAATMARADLNRLCNAFPDHGRENQSTDDLYTTLYEQKDKLSAMAVAWR